jgi:hypothetical protein
LDAPDERVCLYTVRTDTGIDSHKARDLYDDAINEGEPIVDDPNVEEGFIGRGRRFPVKTGFYIDGRQCFKATPKVFLFIQQSNLAQGDKVLCVRPNVGRSLRHSGDVWDNIHGHNRQKRKIYKLCKEQAEIERALEIWDTEFKLADMPDTELYQFSCRGRHRTTTVLAVRC